MHVIVHAKGLLPTQSSPVLTLDHPCTLGEALANLPLSRSTGLMILVNGKLAHWGTALEDGDEVELIPALGGG